LVPLDRIPPFLSLTLISKVKAGWPSPDLDPPLFQLYGREEIVSQPEEMCYNHPHD